MKKFLLDVYSFIKQRKHKKEIQKNAKFAENRIKAEILRNVHSIEKGLSIAAPRQGFGVKKIKEMFSLAERYIQITTDKTVLYFVVDAVGAYLAYQKSVGFESSDIEEIATLKEQLASKIGEHEGVYAGTTVYEKDALTCTPEQVENLFETRHSIRDFSGDPVPEALICKAVALAQRSPSACNRQAVRVYNISPEKYMAFEGTMEGIGGFAQDVDRFLLITGVESAYRVGEVNQFAVSAAMFAGYLTLALHGLGVGACVIQRSLLPHERYKTMRKALGIPEDEQAVVMLGVGMLKDRTTVPMSRRLPFDTIYKAID